MEGDFIKINEWLIPLSWVYGFGVRLRNWCFETGLLKQRKFSVPVISVGNLTVGGCGKTPHVEYLIEILKDSRQVAVLSRGYKRRSKGYLLADKDSTMPQIGDEPYQMSQKYPDVFVAVDKNRCHGIEKLISSEETKSTDVVLLDDAFQHRYVKPGLNILLVDYHRLIIYDKLLPAGRLREPQDGKERADIVIVTKCPEELKPMDYRVLTKAMGLRPYQKLYFTSIAYDSLKKVSDGNTRSLSSIMPDENLMVFSGIASPEQITHDLQPYSKHVSSIAFADHHQFSKADIDKILKQYKELPSPKILITTEKDAARIGHINGLPQEFLDSLYVLPIKIKFQLDKETEFNERIQAYVQNAVALNKLNNTEKK